MKITKGLKQRSIIDYFTSADTHVDDPCEQCVTLPEEIDVREKCRRNTYQHQVHRAWKSPGVSRMGWKGFVERSSDSGDLWIDPIWPKSTVIRLGEASAKHNVCEFIRSDICFQSELVHRRESIADRSLWLCFLNDFMPIKQNSLSVFSIIQTDESTAMCYGKKVWDVATILLCFSFSVLLERAILINCR